MSSEPHSPPVTRSSVLMNPEDTVLVVIDMQERLWPHIANRDEITARIQLLARAAPLVGVEILATEQYRKGLGATISPLAELIGPTVEKTAFSAGLEPAVMKQLDKPGIRKVLVTGIEAHVCVQQTALDLLSSGFQVYLATDCIGSRRSLDCDVAIQRMRSAGITTTTAESAVFEWLIQAGTDTFKAVSALVKSTPL